MQVQNKSAVSELSSFNQSELLKLRSDIKLQIVKAHKRLRDINTLINEAPTLESFSGAIHSVCEVFSDSDNLSAYLIENELGNIGDLNDHEEVCKLITNELFKVTNIPCSTCYVDIESETGWLDCTNGYLLIPCFTNKSFSYYVDFSCVCTYSELMTDKQNVDSCLEILETNLSAVMSGLAYLSLGNDTVRINLAEIYIDIEDHC